MKAKEEILASLQEDQEYENCRCKATGKNVCHVCNDKKLDKILEYLDKKFNN